jgi:hypothetical protein
MYEDFETGERAKKGLDYVAEELGNDLEFRHSMWRGPRSPRLICS